MTFKRCTKCDCEKPTTEFNADLRRTDSVMSRCKTCRNAANKNWKARNPDYETDRYRKNPIGHRERHLIRKYGVTLSDYDAMFVRQLGCCAICGKKQARAFDVDHCHDTKIVRGLLCTNCNRMIGHSADSPERLRRAAGYLESSRRSPTKSSRKSQPVSKGAMQ